MADGSAGLDTGADTRGFVRSLVIAASLHGVAVLAGAAGGGVAWDAADSSMRAAAELVWLEQSDEGGQKAATDARTSESESTGEYARTLAAKAGSPPARAHAAQGAAADRPFTGGVAADPAIRESAIAESAIAESAGDAGLMLDGVWGTDAVGELAGRHALGVRRVGKLKGLADGGLADGGSADGGSADGGSADGGSADGGSGSGGSKAHGPRLQPVADPCHGMFPRAAEHDRGSVVVALRVSESGVPTVPRVIEEFPAGEGFAEAARACLPRLRFEPAADSRGTPVTAESVVRLKFSRG